MHSSRELEVTQKTKFRKGREEEHRKQGNKHRKPHNEKGQPVTGFDMWGDEPESEY